MGPNTHSFLLCLLYFATFCFDNITAAWIQHNANAKLQAKMVWLKGLEQRWANNGARAECGPPQRFQWPAEAFTKYVQI